MIEAGRSTRIMRNPFLPGGGLGTLPRLQGITLLGVHMIRRTAVAAALFFSTFALAQDAGTAAPTGPVEPPPSADLIKKFLDYQENGKDRGPALLDLVPC